MLKIEKQIVKNNIPFLRDVDFDFAEETKTKDILRDKDVHFQNESYTGSMGDSESLNSCYLLDRDGNLIYKLKSGDYFHSNYAYEGGHDQTGEYLLDALNEHRNAHYIVHFRCSYSHWGQDTDHNWESSVSYCVIDWKYVNDMIDGILS